MDFGNLSGKVALVVCVFLMTASVATYAAEQSAGQRIYVVAVHDSSLFTLCHPSLRQSLADGEWKSLPAPTTTWYYGPRDRFYFDRYDMEVHWDSRVSTILVGMPSTGVKAPPPIFPQDPRILERARPDWLELSRMAPGVCPSGWVDPGMAKELESEFKKSKDYVLVDSADKADFVFLAEGLYHCYWVPGAGVRLSFMLNDWQGFGSHFCQAAIAIVVPSEIYRQAPADNEALLAARLWEGISLHKPSTFGVSTSYGVDTSYFARSAPFKDLVKDFLGKKKWPARLPPLQAAWAGAPLRAAVTVRGTDAGQPVLPAQTPKAPVKDQVIRVNTTLVTVPVFASDGEGRRLPGLTVEDFHLYEDGVEQNIDRFFSDSAPVRTALLIDISHSTGTARSGIEAAGMAFAEGLRSGDELMVLSFTNRIFVESELTGDRLRLRRAIAQARARGGAPYTGKDQYRMRNDPLIRRLGTRLYDAVDLAVTERFDRLPGRKTIVLLTDGVDSGSRLASYESTLARIEESDVLVYAVYYETPVPKIIENRVRKAGLVAANARGAAYLQQLTAQSGGRFLEASADTGVPELLSHIAEEMGHQYTLCYYPKASIQDASFRRIQVTVDKPGVKIRARAGYRPVSRSSTAK